MIMFDTFETFWKEKVWPNENKHIRKGQSLFNYLHFVNPDLANEIRATEYDCFYNDDLVPKTLKYLKENWK